MYSHYVVYPETNIILYVTVIKIFWLKFKTYIKQSWHKATSHFSNEKIQLKIFVSQFGHADT